MLEYNTIEDLALDYASSFFEPDHFFEGTALWLRGYVREGMENLLSQAKVRNFDKSEFSHAIQFALSKIFEIHPDLKQYS